MVDWLEDLSEDWPSQPPSSSSAAHSPSASTNNGSVMGSNHPARAPAVASRSFSSAQHRTFSSTREGAERRKSVLGERRISEDNKAAFGRRRESDKPSRKGLSRRSLSAESTQSVMAQGTAQRKSTSTSPPKARQLQNSTPEWRRRLLKGDMGYGEQKDLFSPIGIENIFQKPPPPRREALEEGRGLSFFKNLDAIPSSPPVWQPGGEPFSKSPIKLTLNSTKELEMVEEIEEGTMNDKVQAELGDIRLKEKAAISRGKSAGPEIGEPRERRVASHLMSEPASEMGTSLSQGSSLQSRSDDFSPVFISKHTTADGRVDYAPLDLPKSQIAQHIRELAQRKAIQQTPEPDQQNSDVTEDSSLARLQSEGLPEDLPVGTPDVVSIGEFVSIKRGGYSADGSFRRRPLSPSPLARPHSAPTEDQTGTESVEPSSIELSVLGPLRSPAPRPPQTPKRPNLEENLNAQRNCGSISPLKLFDAHDTFTANKLHRRMSQLEDLVPPIASQSCSQSGTAPTTRNSSINPRGPRIEVTAASTLSSRSQAPNAGSTRQSSFQEHFGAGQLDHYSFSDEFSTISQQLCDDESLPSNSPPSQVFPPGSQQPLRFRVESPSEPGGGEKTPSGKRTHSKLSVKSTVSVTKRTGPRSIPPQWNEDESQQRLEPPSTLLPDGKRPRNSPIKDSTPKRRRTLLRVDFPDPTEDYSASSIHLSHQRFQTAIGKKRKDARYDNRNNIADPEVLARRHILRPRNPTPSQARRQEIEDEVLDAAEEFMASSPRLHAIQEHLDVSEQCGEPEELVRAKAVASEVAAFSEKVAHGMKDEGRKRSVTTQDFLDEAMKIMDYIRNKGRPLSGLDSVEETESEEPFELTPQSFSRPPTRDGRKSGWRSGQPQDLHPRVVSHLRKFQEQEGDEFMASLRTSRFNREVDTCITTMESQPPGLHIIGRSPEFWSPSHSRSNSEITQADRDPDVKSTGIPTHGSQASLDSTLNKTTTSRKSDNVATLAPEAVAHLIPQQVAGMTFDQEKGIWVKAKSPEKKPDTSFITQSEPDPFDSIPDLTVDEFEETRRMVPPKTPTTSDAPGRGISFEFPPIMGNLKSQVPENLDVRFSDPTKPISVSNSSNSTVIRSSHDQAAPHHSRSASWESHERFEDSVPSEKERPSGNHTEDVEHEIKIDEGRITGRQAPSVHAFRSITVALSSPLVANRNTSNFISEQSARRTTSLHGLPFVSKPQPAPLEAIREDKAGHMRSSPAPLATAKNRYLLEEPSAMQRQVNFSMSISNAPATYKQGGEMVPCSSPCRADVTFYMSDLPDFTVDQIDERDLPDRTVVKRHGGSKLYMMEDRFAAGNELLVKALQDTEPEEPYWEDLHKLDLRGKGLTSLHLLEGLCERLESLDISNNNLGQLNGAPSTIRCLNAAGNSLSSLTPWSHLRNLQYLDVSNNDIESLEGFDCLVHLRELRANCNNIRSLKGVEKLDGLLVLSLKHNALQTVDFEGTELHRLTSVNLEGNRLTSVRGLHRLPNLKRLNLDENNISSFPSETPDHCLSLKGLSIRRNLLESLDIARFSPRLEELYADHNLLSETLGISSLKNLRKLSVRGQTVLPEGYGPEPCVVPTVPEIDALYLSHNHIPVLRFQCHFLNLRQLELASAGLHTLPEDFGHNMPNLRSLNLNFNALKDLRPLLNIRHLTALHLVGNRLARLRKSMAVLGKLGHVEALDLRDNPLSVGFYPKAVENRMITTSASLHEGADEEDFGEVEAHSTPQLLPPRDGEEDRLYFGRLDEDTKLRRRVYEILVSHSCPKLTDLDGLGFDRKRLHAKDEVWKRLVELGVVKKLGE
ncbi:hypothetical protein EJ06DRAFT_529489 [Trichodelitschia bisporula]|uniref:L domain-like protein n=1 Tax=Trichodelitschia bisporula TaxID=703511 RepID=A0A6G1HZ83_9PEZI|nr:hypothetical protein EJ06DRAFT_529489 [Trichodelitschia bisporula]